MNSEGNLVFLCGFPSGGTDLLKNIINSNTNVSISGEFPLLYKLKKSYKNPIISDKEIIDTVKKIKKLDVYGYIKPTKTDVLNNKKYKSTISLSKLYFDLLPGSEEIKWKGNKTPQNTEHIMELKELFPKAKFILILRDVRDIALSWKNKWGKNELSCAYRWNKRTLKGLDSLSKLDKDMYLIIKYEDLMTNLEPSIRKICNFLRIPVQDRMFNYHKYVDEIFDGKINYGQPIVKNNFNKWMTEMSKNKIGKIENIAQTAMLKAEYSLTENNRFTVPLVWYIIGITKDLYAMVFIGNKANKKKNFIKRIYNTFRLELRKHF